MPNMPLTAKELFMLKEQHERSKRKCNPERVERLESLLQRFVDYFNDAPSERCAWGPLVRESEDLLED